MKKFYGQECLVCTEKFIDGDDIVVCPDCGTPHHRLCYKENGDCINAVSHGRKFAWKQGLTSGAKTFQDYFEEMVKQSELLDAQRDDFEEHSIYGVSKAELSAYMQIEKGSIDYESKIERIKLLNFNVFAGLLSPFYQFYKGMRFFGLIVLIPIFFTQIMPYLYPGGPEAYLIRFWGSVEQFQTAASVVSLVLMLLLLFFNDYVYLRHSAYKIKRIRFALPKELQSGHDYYKFLRLMGTPRILKAVFETLVCVCVLVVTMYMIL
jgi:hypothetical protein